MVAGTGTSDSRSTHPKVDSASKSMQVKGAVWGDLGPLDRTGPHYQAAVVRVSWVGAHYICYEKRYAVVCNSRRQEGVVI